VSAPPRKRQRGRVLGSALVVLGALAAVGIGGYQVGRASLDTTTVTPAEAAPVTVIARAGTLVEERNGAVSAEWRAAATVANRLSGTVTNAPLPAGQASTVTAGTTLFAVDEVPVLVMPGATPAYRDIGPGVSGTDVRQLQEFLVSAGHAIDPVDGRWRASTTTAYRDWRASTLLPRRQNVVLGEIVFLPSLPLTVRPEADMTTGAIVTPGETALTVLSAAPELRLVVSADGSARLDADTVVTIDVAGRAVTAATTTDEVTSDNGDRSIGLAVTADCSGWCDLIPAAGVSRWPATIRVAGPVNGTVVPVGAIVTDASGNPAVTVSGEMRSVDVSIAVGGEAVVTNVEPGEVIDLPVPQSAPPQEAEPADDSSATDTAGA
jgi:hypothetical protein